MINIYIIIMEIISYPNYLIYPDGKVQNKYTKRYLKPQIDNNYFNIGVTKNKKRKTFRIHRLVALHYIPNPDNKPYIDHKDGNKLNNDINNLRWVTQQENCNFYKSKNCNNKTGIKNIHYNNEYWVYQKSYFGDIFTKADKNKQLILWVKFVDYLILNRV